MPSKTPEKTYSVSELTALIRQDLENKFPSIWVSGEISNFICSAAGHCYFSLKDGQSVLQAVIFRGNAVRTGLAVVLGLSGDKTLQDRSVWESRINGQKIRLRGGISVYAQRGNYQLIADKIEKLGEGDLARRFEELKRQLKEKGWFDQPKKILPSFPSRIGIITSAQGAALRDILQILRRRWPLTSVVIFPSLVQGDKAAAEIAQGIRVFNRSREVDLIIISRGGGSLEDLWAFNEIEVAKAVYESSLPVVSAVGHEVDFTITDFTADLRAPTPSAAAELAVPDRQDISRRINELEIRLTQSMKTIIRQAGQRFSFCTAERLSSTLRQILVRMKDRLERCSEKKMARDLLSLTVRFDLNLNGLGNRLKHQAENFLKHYSDILNLHSQKLTLLDPFQVLQRGYSVTFDAKTGSVLKDVSGLGEGSRVRSVLASGELISKIEEKRRAH